MNDKNSISNLFKFNAYREVANDASTAKNILSNKKLAYGEVGIVPYYYPNQDDPNKHTYMMLGIGWLNGESKCYPIDEMLDYLG